MTDAVNKRLGNYELVELLGEGTQGKIYRACCVAEGSPLVAHGTTVALKILRQGEDASPAFREQIDKVLKLVHPNTARYLDSFVHRDEWGNDLRCLVMEFLDGEDLHHCMQRHPAGLPWERVRSILRQCVAGLAHAYAQGVNHGDIKSSNVHLLPDGSVKVTDFGIRQSECKTVTSEVGSKGTYDFMAPDFLMGEGDFQGDEISDVFSLGVCFYEAMTGKLPYAMGKDAGLMGYLNRWQQGEIAEPEISLRVFRVLNDAAIQFVHKCLQRDRQKRFQSFEEMGRALEGVALRSLQAEKDKYVFEEYLGKGGFGEVFRARRAADGGVFSVKHLFPSHDPVRFLREARLLREHPHANLVAYEDFVKVARLEGDDYYLIMEFLEGMPHWSLRSRIRQEGGLEIPEVVRLFSAYCDALQYLHTAHRKPIVHRDLTPANLYAPPWDPARADERRPKVFDLGIARSDKTQTGGSIPGNPEYMPPEFVLDPDFRGSSQSDLYNLGLCLYEALTGRPVYARLPKDTTEMWRAMRSRAEGKVAVRFDAPVFQQFPRLADIVRRAMQRNPRKRFSSATEMKESLVDSTDSEDETMDFFGEDKSARDTRQAIPAPPVSPPEPAVPRPTAKRESVPPTKPVPPKKPAARVGPLIARFAAGIAIVAVVVGAIVGGSVLWRNTTEDSMLKEIRSFPDRFRVVATDVGRCRKLIEDAGVLAAAGDEDVAEAIQGLHENWSSIPGRFEAAFAGALEDDDLDAADGVLLQWARSVESLPYRDINLAIHGKRLGSMERRIAFARTVAGLAKVEATAEYASRLGAALADARAHAADEAVSGAAAWWESQVPRLAKSAAKLPQTTAEEVTRLLADAGKLGDAQERVATWSEIAATENLAEHLPKDAGKQIDNAVTSGMVGLVEGKKKDVVAAYAKGDETAAEAALAWLSDSQARYPALYRPVAPLFLGVAASAAKAQSEFLVVEIRKLPVDLAGDGLAGAVAALKAISARYEKWRPGWNAGLLKNVDEAGTTRCRTAFDRYAKQASAAYEKQDTDAGDRNVSLLKQFSEKVPGPFGAAELAARIEELTKVGNALAELREDLTKALAGLDMVARDFAADDPALWKRALDGWRTARFKEGVRERDVVREKVQEAGAVLKATAERVIPGSISLDALAVMREVLAEAVKAGVLPKDTETSLIGLIAPRETLLQLKALEGPLSANDPVGWGKALDAWAGLAVPGSVRGEQAVAQEWARLEKAFEAAAGKRIAGLTAAADVDAMGTLLGRKSAVAVLAPKVTQALARQLADVQARLRGLAELARIRDSVRDGRPDTWKKAVGEVAPYLKTEAYRNGGKMREICDEIATSISTGLEALVRQKGPQERVFAGLVVVSEVTSLARDGGLFAPARAEGIAAAAAKAGLGLVGESLKADVPATWLQAIADLVALAPVVKGTPDGDVQKLLAALTGRIADHVRSHAAKVDPLEERVQRIREAGAALTSATQSGLFAAEFLTAARTAVVAEQKQFVLRVMNRSGEEAVVGLGGKTFGKVAAGKEADFRLPASGGQVSVELSAGGAHLPRTEQLVALSGGAKQVQVSGWRPRPRGVDLAKLKGIKDLAIAYTRRRDAKQVALDEHTQLLPGEEYELVYRRPGFAEQKHSLRPLPAVAPVALPPAGKWVETEQLSLLRQLEQAVEGGDTGAAEAVLAKLEREGLTAWPGQAERFDKARNAWRKLRLGGAQKGWDSAAAKWNAADYRGASMDFHKLAEVFDKAGWKDQHDICSLNHLLAVFLYSSRGTGARRTPARSIVKLCDDSYPKMTADRKRSLDSILARMRSYLTLSRQMASLEEVNLERDVPKVGPVPLPE